MVPRVPRSPGQPLLDARAEVGRTQMGAAAGSKGRITETPQITSSYWILGAELGGGHSALGTEHGSGSWSCVGVQGLRTGARSSSPARRDTKGSESLSRQEYRDHSDSQAQRSSTQTWLTLRAQDTDGIYQRVSFPASVSRCFQKPEEPQAR